MKTRWVSRNSNLAWGILPQRATQLLPKLPVLTRGCLSIDWCSVRREIWKPYRSEWIMNSALSPRNVIWNDQVMMTVVRIIVMMVMMIIPMTMTMTGRCEQMARATAMGRGEVTSARSGEPRIFFHHHYHYSRRHSHSHHLGHSPFIQPAC